jgi:ABC-type multidrug transport system fused ATPase/permease subunit
MKTKQLIDNYVLKRKKTLIVYLICCILYYPLQTATFTIATGKLFDKLANIQKNKASIYQLILLISILYVIINLSLLGKEKIESFVIPEFNNDLRNMIFDNIINKMRIKFKDVDIGEFISRISMITLKWDEVIQYAASIIIPQSLTVIVILSVLTYFGPKYGLITMIYIFGVFILLLPRYKNCLKKLIDLRYSLNNRHNDIQDKINNLFDIYLANKENEEKTNNKINESQYNKEYEEVLTCNLKNSMLISFLNIAYFVSMLYLVINNLYSNSLSKSIAITIILLLTYVIGIIDSLFKAMIGASFSYSVLKESEEFLNYISEYDVSDKGVKVKAHSTIQIKNVTFKYKKDIVLDQINLIIKKNDKVIIKGRSGSGKSTLIKLICGFYSPTKGEILIDNKNINNINVENLRSQISMLNQNVKLFNISIYDNIRYTNKNISKNTIDKFINKHKINLYNDLDLNSKAGQNGNNLSGGQKQMTLIIRCLLANKNLLFFDEPTSALDNYHFNVFNNIIKDTNKTIIVITHDARFDKSKFNNKYHLDKGILKKIF